MSTTQDKFADRVLALQTELRDVSKTLALRNEELCTLLAQKLVSSVEVGQPLFASREDAALPFLSVLADACQAANSAVPLLLCGASEFLCRGPESLIDAHGKKVASALGAKAGGRKGVLQGKSATPFTREQRDEAVRVLAEAMRA